MMNCIQVHTWPPLNYLPSPQRHRVCASLEPHATAPRPVQPQPQAEPHTTCPSSDARHMVVALAKVAWDTKGEDVTALHVAEQASWCSYMVFVTIFSKPQLNAMVAKLETEAVDNWGRQLTPPTGRSAWEIVDLGDVVVHILSAEMREYYAIERFYAAAEEVELPFLQERVDAASLHDWRTTS